MASRRCRDGVLVLADGSVFEGELFGADRRRRRPARSCSTPPCRATRRSSPTRATPGRSSRSPTRTSATTASTRPTSSPRRLFCRGVVVRELARRPSNRAVEADLDAMLRALRHPGHRRHRHPPPDPADPRHRRHPRRLRPGRPAGRPDDRRRRGAGHRRRSTSSPRSPRPSRTRSARAAFRIVAYDYGIKRTILRHLAGLGTVEVVPASTPAADVVARDPDGVFLSNGPGDPAEVGRRHRRSSPTCSASGIPIFGICLGNQLLGRALGGTTVKLPFGHHGANHPVKDLTTGTIEITQPEPQLRRRHRLARRGRRPHPRQPQRRRVRGPRRPRRQRLQRAAPPRGRPRPPRQPLPVRPLRRPHDGVPRRPDPPTLRRCGQNWPPAPRVAEAAANPSGCRSRRRGWPDAAGATTSTRSSSSAPGRS